MTFLLAARHSPRAGAVAVSAAVPLPSTTAAEFDYEALTVDEWLASSLPDLADIADLLARWEREGIERELPVCAAEQYMATMEFRAVLRWSYRRPRSRRQ